ncbi:hypothetical protein KAI36_01566 [Paenibacillus sp. S02]|nr:hypothetical protein KAI36_01566 [Paenibacillus sp. S02]
MSIANTQGKYLFYYFLELDPQTIRYYPQPINIQLQLINKDFVKVKKEHVPDVLVFREGKMPHLYKACTDYCNDKGWKYSVIYPKTLSSIVKRNLHSIMHYKHIRSDFDAFSHEIKKLDKTTQYRFHIVARYFQKVIPT